eukprot:TRINITY_DN5453_c0_g1_i2.p1 TRINITY_DN5453_c0_g1~~TRINITY_DN5453_c0_g1_i2.p1  ORF type:complete len:555 (+),score=112.81 TRINITY_DN5453_c0_g1_i2:34-1665(+)
MDAHFSALLETANKYPLQPNIHHFYGTAGFRALANTLPPVLFRIGCLAFLRSLSLGRSIGVMVTASHNPEHDNGVKLVDPDGEMLAPAWEKHATTIANAKSSDIVSTMISIAKSESVDLTKGTAKIIVGRDTRPSSLSLVQAVKDSVQTLGGTIDDLGEITTPQLHWAVYRTNRNLPGNVEAYYTSFTNAFKQSLIGAQQTNKQPIVIDCANGIGAIAAKEFSKILKDDLAIEIRNDARTNLNHLVGADFVKSRQQIPNGVDPKLDIMKKFVSLDGDADRLIYFYLDENGAFHLLDGDKISTLIASFIISDINTLGIKDLTLGVVQTAYANGASTHFIEKVLGVTAACTLTGVKHLHHMALKFDIGIYFEANGHGTVTFSENGIHKLKALQEHLEKDTNTSLEKKQALKRLLNLPDLINQAIGDAMSDILVIESILRHKNWTLKEWDSMYQDLPNKLIAHKVKDRSVITTTDVERKVVTPKGLQEAIDAAVSKYHKGRSFVRPSGTEDVVRIYAEAATKEEAEKLAAEVTLLVNELAGGIATV